MDSTERAEKRAAKMCHEAGILHRGTDEPREDVIEVMLKFVTSEILRLAEEAEREARELIKQQESGRFPRHSDMPKERGLIAEWLRSKAEEEL